MKNLNEILSQDPEFIYTLLIQIKHELKTLMPFGASNSTHIDTLYFNIDNTDIESLNFPAHLNIFERAKVIARHELNYHTITPHVEVFIKGIGVCSHLNFFALMLLAKEYDFEARLENIHADEVHTYIVISDRSCKEYILDFWSNSALAYDDDIQWNESMPYKYARKKDHHMSVDSYWSADDLNSLWPQLENQEAILAKKKYYDQVMARAFKSTIPRFFVSQESTTMLLQEQTATHSSANIPPLRAANDGSLPLFSA
jgi:hypothetical protein